MKIAVINDVHVGRALEHEGKIRASSHLVEDLLDLFIQKIIRQHFPDVLMNLGDLIRSEGRNCDSRNYRRVLSYFKQLDLPVIHLLGNHELKQMSLEQVEQIWHEGGYHQKSYGCIEYGSCRLLWLGLESSLEDPKRHMLPQDQLIWLKAKLSRRNPPVVIFTHCAMDDHDLTGNYFCESLDNQDKRGCFLQNHQEVTDIISASKSVCAVLQAHLHYFHTKEIDGIPYVTCPAMGDNICGPNTEENIPEIYTIL